MLIVVFNTNHKHFHLLSMEVKHGTMGYTPDFKIGDPYNGYYWIEVKGFLKAEDKTKLNRFKKFYPEGLLNFV